MKDRIKIPISQKDIEETKSGNPIVHAISRRIGLDITFETKHRRLFFTGTFSDRKDTFSMELPSEANDFIGRFSRGEEVKPFSLWLDFGTVREEEVQQS